MTIIEAQNLLIDLYVGKPETVARAKIRIPEIKNLFYKLSRRIIDLEQSKEL